MSNFASERLAARASTRRIPELDGLRAIAILLVIGCHYPAFAAAVYGLPEFGWVGVEIFFVLSGFLITSILLPLKTKPHPYIPFLERRAARIMPPYFLVLLIVAMVYWAGTVLRPGDNPTFPQATPVLARNLVFASSMSGNVQYLWRTWRVLTGAIHAVPILARTPLSPNLPGISSFDFPTAVGHFWSVSVEEWYYVLWAPVVLLLKRSGVVVTGILLIVFAFFVRWFGFSNWEWYVNFLCRCDMLAVGGLLALWIEKRAGLSQEARHIGDRVLQGISLVALGGLTLLLSRLWPFLGKDIRSTVSFACFGPLLIALIVAGLLAVLLNGSLSRQLPCRVLRLPPLVYIGRRSYMLYLVHVPIYILVARIFPLAPDAAGLRSWTVAMASSVLSLAMAALSWRFFESPILSYRDRQSVRKQVADAATPKR